MRADVRPWRWAIGLSLGLAALPGAAEPPAPAAAAIVPAQPANPIPDAELQRALDAAQQAIAAQDCHAALVALDPVVPRLGDTSQRAVVQRLRLPCLGVDGRVADIGDVQRELARSMPQDGLVRAFGVLVAADANRFVDAASQISTLAATSPHNLEILTGTSVRAIAIRLTEQHAFRARDDMLVALAKADWQPIDMPELRSSFAEGAMEALLGSGRNDEAAGLLDRIDEPEMLASLAIERRYAPLWPVIESRLGPGSGTAVDQFAQDRLAFYASNPTSEPALRDAADAMLLLGRYDDVIDMTDGVMVHEGMTRDAVNTLLTRARAFAALKRDDDVVKLFAAFLALDLQRTPEASPALVRYAEFLDEIGREADALSVARLVQQKASAILSDFGKRWLDRTEVCALSALGRAPEANAAADRMKLVVAQNQPATIEALLCANRGAEASSIAVKAFEDSDMASNLLLQFQPASSTWAAMPSRLRQLWYAFLTRPEIKVAFERKGRMLPRGFWPSPEPRAVPHRGGGSALT